MRAILTYHSIDASGSAISLDAAAFAAHVRWLARCGVPVVRVDELLAMPAGSDGIAVTFDDGFANFATHAWPLLREHGLAATVFVVSDLVGGTNSWDARSPGVPALSLLGWSDLALLREQGVEIGAHTRTHPDLRHCSDAALAEELEGGALRILARLGERPTSFAYPFGAADQRVVMAARRSYQTACTTEFRVLGSDEEAHRLPRLDTFYFRDVRRLEAWGSRQFKQRVWLRARARAARRALTRIGVLK